MDEEYLLFRTQVGEAFKAFDPFKVDRVFARELNGERLGKVVSEARGVQQPDGSFVVTDVLAADLAAERLYHAARVAFDLHHVLPDGSGFTEKTVLRVFNEFMAFRVALKKNIERSATASPPTAAPTSANPSPPSNGTPYTYSVGEPTYSAPKLS